MDEFDDYPEPYENDLEDLGNREAWEDAQADMRSDYENDTPLGQAYGDGSEE